MNTHNLRVNLTISDDGKYHFISPLLLRYLGDGAPAYTDNGTRLAELVRRARLNWYDGSFTFDIEGRELVVTPTEDCPKAVLAWTMMNNMWAAVPGCPGVVFTIEGASEPLYTPVREEFDRYFNGAVQQSS